MHRGRPMAAAVATIFAMAGLAAPATAGAATGPSVTAAANASFITQLKHSGYFDQIEIKESTQDTKNAAIQTFTFTLTAQFSLPQEKPANAAGKS